MALWMDDWLALSKDLRKGFDLAKEKARKLAHLTDLKWDKWKDLSWGQMRV